MIGAEITADVLKEYERLRKARRGIAVRAPGSVSERCCMLSREVMT